MKRLVYIIIVFIRLDNPGLDCIHIFVLNAYVLFLTTVALIAVVLQCLFFVYMAIYL